MEFRNVGVDQGILRLGKLLVGSVITLVWIVLDHQEIVLIVLILPGKMRLFALVKMDLKIMLGLLSVSNVYIFVKLVKVMLITAKFALILLDITLQDVLANPGTMKAEKIPQNALSAPILVQQ